MKPDLHAKDRIKLAGEQVSDIFIREVNLVCGLSKRASACTMKRYAKAYRVSS